LKIFPGKRWNIFLFLYICKKNILQLNNAISNLPDNELLISFRKSRDNIYFVELFIRYLPLLFGVCLKYLNDVSSAQDAVICIFENLQKHIKDYKIDEFRSWIYNFTKSHCLQLTQKKERVILKDVKNPVLKSIDNSIIECEYDEVVDLSEEVDSEENKTAFLVDCLNELPEEQRASLIYFFVDELSFADIVNKTGYPLKQVKSYVQNGKQNLKTRMASSFQ